MSTPISEALQGLTVADIATVLSFLKYTEGGTYLSDDLEHFTDAPGLVLNTPSVKKGRSGYAFVCGRGADGRIRLMSAASDCPPTVGPQWQLYHYRGKITRALIQRLTTEVITVESHDAYYGITDSK